VLTQILFVFLLEKKDPMTCLIGIQQEQNFHRTTPWIHPLCSLHSWACPTW